MPRDTYITVVFIFKVEFGYRSGEVTTGCKLKSNS